MQLNRKALALASAAVWGSAILLVGLINLAQPDYGATFLQMVASVYPGYHAVRDVGDVFVGTGYALVDGWIGGWLLAWCYNRFSRPA